MASHGEGMTTECERPLDRVSLWNLNSGTSLQHVTEEGGRYGAGCHGLLSNSSFVTFRPVTVSWMLPSSLVHSFLISVVGPVPCFSL